MIIPVKRVDFSYTRSDLRNVDSTVVNLRGDYMVWWYNSIRHNSLARTVPLVDVLFKRLIDDVPGAISLARVPLSNLPHYRIGTVWREGKCISDTQLVQEEFQVDFSPQGWSITSRDELYNEGLEHVFLDDEYPLKYRRDKSHLLSLTDIHGRTLLVPCIEFLVRGYARNMDVCRAIATLRFDDVKACFFDPPSRDAHHWLVRPTHKARDYDALFLAHLLYDDYTERRVRRINSQFMATKPGDIVLPKVEPWFTGSAELRCRGKWINNGNTFLCLDLCGASKPNGRDIEWIRETYDGSDGKDGAGRIVMPKAMRTAEAEHFLAEESFAEPDNLSETIIVKAPPFAELGVSQRVVRITRTVIKTEKGKLGPTPPCAESHSSGSGHGSGKSIGKSEHVSDLPADAQIQSQDFLNDIWNAFHSIKARNPERVTELSWLTPPSSGTTTPPRIVLFNSEGVDHTRYDILKWINLSEGVAQRRGMLFIQARIDGQSYLCIEIQRAQPDAGTPKPPGFSGVLMKCDITDLVELEDFIHKVCIRTRTAVGRFMHIRKMFPQATKIFRHRRHDDGQPHRRRLVNAFRELDVILD